MTNLAKIRTKKIALKFVKNVFFAFNKINGN